MKGLRPRPENTRLNMYISPKASSSSSIEYLYHYSLEKRITEPVRVLASSRYEAVRKMRGASSGARFVELISKNRLLKLFIFDYEFEGTGQTIRLFAASKDDAWRKLRLLATKQLIFSGAFACGKAGIYIRVKVFILMFYYSIFHSHG